MNIDTEFDGSFGAISNEIELQPLPEINILDIKLILNLLFLQMKTEISWLLD